VLIVEALGIRQSSWGDMAIGEVTPVALPGAETAGRETPAWTWQFGHAMHRVRRFPALGSSNPTSGTVPAGRDQEVTLSGENIPF
jgi:hypothetical protein